MTGFNAKSQHAQVNNRISFLLGNNLSIFLLVIFASKHTLWGNCSECPQDMFSCQKASYQKLLP